MRLDAHVGLLARVPFLDGLSKDQLNMLAFMGGRRHFQPGELIVRAGAVAYAGYVILSGTAILKGHEGHGPEAEDVALGPGDMFGELAMFVETTTGVGVETVDVVTALEITRPVMRAILQHDPAIAVHFSARIGERLRRMSKRLEDLALSLDPSLADTPALAHLPVPLDAGAGNAGAGDAPARAGEADVIALHPPDPAPPQTSISNWARTGT